MKIYHICLHTMKIAKKEVQYEFELDSIKNLNSRIGRPKSV